MELYYTFYRAGRGTRQPREYLFYIPDLDFVFVAHKTAFTGDTFLKFIYDEARLQKVRDDISKGNYKKIEIPDSIVSQIKSLGEQYQSARSSLNPLVEELFKALG